MSETGRSTAVHYVVTVDRAGHAVAAGGLAIAVVTTGLMFVSGLRAMGGLANTAFAAAFLGIVAIVAVGGPVWLALHASGRRGPGNAAGAGFSTAALLGVFGTALMPPGDAGAIVRLLATIGNVLGIAALGAGVALMMWRIAYRKD